MEQYIDGNTKYEIIKGKVISSLFRKGSGGYRTMEKYVPKNITGTVVVETEERETLDFHMNASGHQSSPFTDKSIEREIKFRESLRGKSVTIIKEYRFIRRYKAWKLMRTTLQQSV